MIFGGMLEGMVGFLPTCLVYIMSGIGGNVFSSACMYDGDNSVGASTAINGLLTGMLAVVVVNWSAFTGHPQLEQLRCILLFVIIFLVFLNTIMGVGSGSIDYLGHLGGALTGFIWGLAFMPRVASPAGETMKKVGIGLTVLFFGLTFGLLYGLH